jgi:hypothetical protein
MAAYRGIVRLPGLKGVNVGSADSAQCDVYDRFSGRWLRIGHFDQGELFFTGDQSYLHGEFRDDLILLGYASRTAR